MKINRYLTGIYVFLFWNTVIVFGNQTTSNYLCSYAVFLRRVTIATTGCLPQTDKVKQFLLSSQPDKRQLLID